MYNSKVYVLQQFLMKFLILFFNNFIDWQESPSCWTIYREIYAQKYDSQHTRENAFHCMECDYAILYKSESYIHRKLHREYFNLIMFILLYTISFTSILISSIIHTVCMYRVGFWTHIKIFHISCNESILYNHRFAKGKVIKSSNKLFSKSYN